MQEFYYLNAAEVMLFFRRFKLGRYGRFYGSVDPQVITRALGDFRRDRMDAISRHDAEQERLEREAARNNPDNMSRAEYDEIMIIQRMYEMSTNGHDE